MKIVRCALVIFALLAPSSAMAGSCQGVVTGLSSTYNKAKGSGFLAVRQKPGTKSRKIGELFNGNVVEVSGRQGNWIRIYFWKNELSGWVFQKYVDRGCDGI